MAERDEQFTELPLDDAGTQLRRAREMAGLSLADIAARTRIAERHLTLIESGNFIAMASRAYAVGFSRSYARTVGLDEQEIAQAVRDELARQEPNSDRYQPAPFEPGDPARVPGPRIAWIAALGALAVVVAGYILWRSFYAPAMSLPDLTDDATSGAASGSAQASGAAPQSGAQGPVVFTALEPGVWIKIYDTAGNQLLQKQLALGESFTVPAEAAGPMIRTARPDALQVSVGGRVVAKLSDRQTTIDAPVSAAALLERVPSPAPLTGAVPASPAAASNPGVRPVAQAGTGVRRDAAAAPSPAAMRSASATPAPSPIAAAASAGAPSPAATASQSSTVSQ